MNTRVERFHGPVILVHGLGQLRRSGVTPRGLLFLALEPAGAIQVGVPEDVDEVTRIKVGEKLSLGWSGSAERLYHYDSVHRVEGGLFLYNGDRRLTHAGDATEVAGIVADYLKAMSAKNVFFGCNPHQPGSWLVRGGVAVALHEAGYVEVVPVAQGLLARRTVDSRLWLLPSEELAASRGGQPTGWRAIFESPLGNVLMLERRVIGERLVLTCERGLVEVSLATLPATAREVARVETPSDAGFGVVGRLEGTAFAVTRGVVREWGLDEIRPAVLIGAAGGSLEALGEALAAAATAPTT